MTDAPRWVPVLILFGLLALAYLGMWRGWRRRGRRHDLPPLVEASPAARSSLVASGRYFGTTTAGSWLDRVVARGLGTRSGCDVSLSDAGMDVVRPSASFRIPADALRGARLDKGIAGKVVPPHGILVVTWQHGDLLLDSGFRFADPGQHEAWVQAVTRATSERA
jgi:hypothetical protein